MATADGRALAVLVAVPLVVFVVPALFGHPAIGGDNAIQNFPLRVLVGNLVAGGHLPLWNPYIWSGSPLLGGLNAGAAYPLTLCFAVLAPVAAWVVNLLAVYWAAGLGVYALLRQFGVRPLPGVLAGLSYAFAGAMSGQIVHLGVVQGMGWAPWVVLALVRLSWAVLGTGPRTEEGPGPSRRGSPWPWVVLLAATLGLVVLTGEPRSMAEVEVVASAVVVWMAVHPHAGWTVGWRRRAAFVGYSALAAVWGVALGAVQIVPGWSFINASQRASESYQFFGAGSLRPSWTALLLVPDLFGGDGLFHQPAYFNNYNLPEVTGYLGLLPLVAAVALLAGCLGRRRDPRAADWALFLALGGLGLLLTWGDYTPLGHLFVHIPLFGKTRLQSRNLGIVDLALAALFGFWADAALGRATRAAGLDGPEAVAGAGPGLRRRPAAAHGHRHPRPAGAGLRGHGGRGRPRPGPHPVVRRPAGRGGGGRRRWWPGGPGCRARPAAGSWRRWWRSTWGCSCSPRRSASPTATPRSSRQRRWPPRCWGPRGGSPSTTPAGRQRHSTPSASPT